jgi:tetratricopeptide (TPR) repeat protein
MSTKNLSSIEKWKANFEQHPLEALDRLLIGRAYMGMLEGNDTHEILFRLFHTETEDRRTELDKAMRSWFEKYLETAPPSISVARWNEILRNAFSTITRLNLREMQTWLQENYVCARAWLQSLYLGPSRDPEAYLLRTLSLCQSDQKLLPLWMRLCRLEEDRPLYFASIGLLGLCKLPDENGEPHGDLHSAVFSGIVDLANAIDKQVIPRKEGEAFWSLEVRALMARYPRSMQYWTEHFLPLISSNSNSTAARWLGNLIPRLKKALDGTVTVKTTTTRRFLQPPSRDEFGIIRELIERCPLEEIRPKLDLFLKEHERYALQTGDADILVKVFCEVGHKILSQDPNWSLALVEKAFSWAPYDHYTWNERATIGSYLGRYERAVQLLWEAKRKFPENPQIRNNLAEVLRKKDKNDIAEIVYRQVVEDFPENVVCRSGLAEVLKEQGKLDEAETVYRQTVKDFPENVVCRNGLAEVLKAQGILGEAEDVYRQTMEDFPEDTACRTGLAVIWLIQGKKEDSVHLLEKIIEQFPNDPIAKGFLQRKKGSQEDLSIEELSAAMAQEDETTSLPVIEEDAGEVQIGLANLYRLAARRAKGEEKVRYRQEFITACEKALADNPNNTFALLEKGFGMLEQEPEIAERFFAEQTMDGKPHVLGFRMGYLQAKILKGETVTDEQWEKLMDEFPNKKTLIRLENVLQELRHGNGTILPVLETLRKQMRTDMEALPRILRENEEWMRSSVEKRLFAEIDLESPLSEDILPLLLENHAQSNLILQGIVEQSLTKI